MCHQNVYTKIEYILYKISRPVNHLGTKLVSPHEMSSLAYIIYKNTHRDTHGASRAPPPGPPLGGGGPPAIGPSGPGGNRPVIATPTTAAHQTTVHHINGTPTHFSRMPSSWIHDHMPSGTPCSTISKSPLNISHPITLIASTNEVAMWAL
jgi:hypothetical protein